MKAGALFALLILGTAGAARSEEPMYEFIEKQSAPAEVVIELDRVSSYVIPQGLFGKFTENLGHNIYGGFWAQVFENASLEPIQHCKRSKRYSSRQKAVLRQITREDLPTDYDEKNVGYGWFRWNGDWADYSFSEDAYNSAYSQRIIVRQVPEDATAVGIRQLVDLPFKRVREYDLAFYVKGSGGRLVAQVRSAQDPQRVYATLELPATEAGDWQRLTSRLVLDIPEDRRRESFWFTLGLAAPGEVLLDQITLFPADAVEGYDPEVIRWATESRIQVLRFPGGNYASGYHWKDDLVPMDKRPTKPNPAWDICDPHHVGTDEHIRFCRLIGAEPLICINAGDGTPQDAADLVEYCNGGPQTRWGRLRVERGFPEPYDVKLWEIGNELWGDWQIGHCSAEEYARRYRAFHDAMKAADPGLHLIACGHIQDDWNAPLIEQCSDILRSLSVHLLFTNSGPASPEYCHLSHMGYGHVCEDVFRRIHEQGRQKGIDLKIAITEEMSFNLGEAQPNPSTLSEALYYAGVLNSSIRTEGIVELFTHSALINHGGGLAKTRGVVFAHPVYYARQRLQQLAGGRPVAFRVSGPFADVPEWMEAWAGPQPKRFPLIDVMPVRQGNALHIVLLNRAPEGKHEVVIEVEGGRFAGDGDLFELRGTSFLARNELVHPERVVPERSSFEVPSKGPLTLSLEPASLSVLTLRDQVVEQ